MSKFPVSPKKEQELISEMQRLLIKESDIEEKFIRCSGHGGQKVNKTSSGVFLRHIPTGIEIKYTKERSLGLNRFFARRLLVDKIKEKLGISTQKSKEIEKIKKKKLRSKRRNKKKREE
ncbi:MAG: peptide chain release factor-like protein [Thermodesulfovibrio sp.]|jgi:protein subunit release factor B|uniref:peptide chain release factor family protein n=1 Tax=unclassified Thermodesulfovibrio TaxID=2645936 RepID=UPI00083B1C13|nr:MULTISPECIES: peptide chain release factor-like protein [unclassified Thermodesulfovibrio]MDI1472022.1 peptide chain release factor-like protein [Thermodesulfovibrio sp. 1176]MDI6715185.1 peptide chain release factor-like protein [Thermodesulfovibrio sp.]ODA45221.1 Class I peptide chain release factor [Thermodesulfovibrio sp. N1]